MYVYKKKTMYFVKVMFYQPFLSKRKLKRISFAVHNLCIEKLPRDCLECEKYIT